MFAPKQLNISLGLSVALLGLVMHSARPTHAAVVSYTSDVLNADSDISTSGALVVAINSGGTGDFGPPNTTVTWNGVPFAADNGTYGFFAANNHDYGALAYTGGAIGSLSLAQTQDLLDSFEFPAGAGESLAVLTGLTPGRTYLVQLLLVDQLLGTTNTADVGFAATPNGAEVYTVTGLPIGTGPYVVNGTFVADATTQDLHIQLPSGTSTHGSLNNGWVNAFQLRDLGVVAEAAVPEPSTFVLAALGLAGLGLVAWRRKK